MERITISLDDELARQFDALLARKGYGNRSEAVRDLIRGELERERLARAEARWCVATLSYVFNHQERELARRLTQAQHHHHDLHLSTLHLHLDHDNCLEVVVLQGKTEQVRRFSDQVMAEAGVRHGHLNLIPVELEVSEHAHSHSHRRPQT